MKLSANCEGGRRGEGREEKEEERGVSCMAAVMSACALRSHQRTLVADGCRLQSHRRPEHMIRCQRGMQEGAGTRAHALPDLRSRRRCTGAALRWHAHMAICLALMAPSAVSGAHQGCAVGDGRGPTIRGVSAVMGIQGTVTDPAGNLQGTPVPGPHAIDAVWDGPKQRQRITAVVGSRIELNISAAWGWADDVQHGVWYGNAMYGDYNLSLYAYEDPGVPNGAILTTQACLGYPQQFW